MKTNLRSRLPVLLALLAGLGLAWVLPAGWLFVPEELASASSDDGTRYACPMFCVVLDELPEDPRCPVCRMKLAPISDTTTLNRHEQWISGLRGVALTRMPLVRELRLYGEVAYDERRVEVVSSRTTGWLEKLTRRVTWEEVREGEVLAEIFSPELQVAQQELLIARGLGEEVLAAAREKLSVRYGLDMRDVDAVLVAGTPLRRLPYRAPTSGVIVRRTAVQGAYVTVGEELFVLADLEHVWLQFEVFESDARWLSLGSSVELRSDWPSDPGDGGMLLGSVVFVDPVVDRASRTRRVRVDVANWRRPDGTWSLAPGSRVSATLRVALDAAGRPTSGAAEPALALPRSALMRTGERDVTYVLYRDVQRPDGKRHRMWNLDPARLPAEVGYELVQIEVGPLAQRADVPQSEWYYPVVRVIASAGSSSGTFPAVTELTEGQVVVIEGALLLDSQAQLAGRPSLYYPLGREAAAADDPHAGH